jgi:hypothetical protein
MRRGSRNLYDAMVARLTRSTLRHRFDINFNEETLRWEISFNQLSEEEFNLIFLVRLRAASSRWRLGGNSGHRTIRIIGLTGGQARDFSRAVALRFRGQN